MITVILVGLLPIIPILYWRSLAREAQDPRALYIVLLGLLPRLLFSSVVRNFPFFSYGNSGDAIGYEYYSRVIARIWTFEGLHYVTGNEVADLREASFPPNLFALAEYANGEPSHFANTALVATIAAVTLLNIYSIGWELGAPRTALLRTLALITFLPTYIFFTADTHKDGLVSFFVFGSFACAVRIARKFSSSQLIWACFYLLGLWLTRYYLVFIMAIPLLIGLLGVRAMSFGRIALIGIILGFGIAAVLMYSQVLTHASESATHAYDRGTSDAVLNGNAEGGSGVLITASGPLGFLERLAYSLLAPFPWQSGSLAVHLEKFEMPIWYYCLYRTVRTLRVTWRDRLSELLLFASWMVPTALAYTLSFSNIGLALRERMNVVLATILLTSFTWGREDEAVDAGAARSLYPASRAAQ